MKIVPEFTDGYYWARHPEGTTFIVMREDGQFYICGQREPMSDEFDPASQIIKPAQSPHH